MVTEFIDFQERQRLARFADALSVETPLWVWVLELIEESTHPEFDHPVCTLILLAGSGDIDKIIEALVIAAENANASEEASDRCRNLAEAFRRLRHNDETPLDHFAIPAGLRSI